MVQTPTLFFLYQLIKADEGRTIGKVYIYEMSVPGITFYDFISKLIPGTLLWAPWILFSYKDQSSSFDFGNMGLLWDIVIFTGFYITGMIWDFFTSKLIFKWLRLYPCMLIKAKKKYLSDAGKAVNNIPAEPNAIKNEYVEAYYKGLKNNLLRDLPILESHENFLKTNWILIGYYAVIAGIFLSGAWQVVVLSLLIIAFGGVPFLWYKIQMRIYYLVWEAEGHIKKPIIRIKKFYKDKFKSILILTINI